MERKADLAHPVFTSKSTMSKEHNQYRFTFFCDLCEEGYTTGMIRAEGTKEAFILAEREARPHFNRCRECHKWVCDIHYNEDEMMCTECAPKKIK